MSGHDDHKGFSAEKIFALLFAFTAIEVGWGYAGHHFGWPKWLFWGGLCFWALLKGLYILQYFMHFRFEGWIIRGLVAPTPFLIVVILTVLSPDVACNHKLNHPIGSMYDAKTGGVLQLREVMGAKGLKGHGEVSGAAGGAHGAAAGATGEQGAKPTAEPAAAH